jgi:SAM-dependent methyltransferase
MLAVNAIKKITRGMIRLSMIGTQRGPHITRYYMYHRLSRFRVIKQRNAKVLSISHSVQLCTILGFDHSQIIEANYPDYDILGLPFQDNEFDYVVSDQVLEHVQGDPQQAIDETFRVLKPGGTAIHTTCFINPIHGAPNDYWRFTPYALTLLCKRFSKIVEVDGWGNPLVWVVVWLGLRFEGIPESRWHPLHKLATYHDPIWPIITWVIAQK